MHYWRYTYMEQEKITFHEYLLTKRGKEVHLKK